MKIFTLYIEDDRYSVPTLLTVERRDDAQALDYASGLLTDARHYLSVETWDGDRQVGTVRRDGAADDEAGQEVASG